MWNFNPSDRFKANKRFSAIEIGFLILIGLIFLTIFVVILIIIGARLQRKELTNIPSSIINQEITPSSSPTLPPIPTSKILDNGNYHVFQSFNNCGPASLSMTLHFYGINKSQEEIGLALRPYQITGGDNDDKRTTFDELADYSKQFGIIPYHRPMGTPEIMEELIANDMPVIVHTWSKPIEDIGHFRVLKGYNKEAKTFIQDDSLQGKNLIYTYDDFNNIWEKHNFEYLVLVPKEKQTLVDKILGENKTESSSWQNAVNYSLEKLKENPSNTNTRFNLSVAYYHTGNYKESVKEFEKVESSLTSRTLWYQIEPIQAYFELRNYDKVFQLTDKILNNGNRAFSELYILRGKSYEKLGNIEASKEEFQKAVFYNANNQEAKELLNSI